MESLNFQNNFDLVHRSIFSFGWHISRPFSWSTAALAVHLFLLFSCRILQSKNAIHIGILVIVGNARTLWRRKGEPWSHKTSPCTCREEISWMLQANWSPQREFGKGKFDVITLLWKYIANQDCTYHNPDP